MPIIAPVDKPPLFFSAVVPVCCSFSAASLSFKPAAASVDSADAVTSDETDDVLAVAEVLDDVTDAVAAAEEDAADEDGFDEVVPEGFDEVEPDEAVDAEPEEPLASTSSADFVLLVVGVKPSRVRVSNKNVYL